MYPSTASLYKKQPHPNTKPGQITLIYRGPLGPYSQNGEPCEKRRVSLVSFQCSLALHGFAVGCGWFTYKPWGICMPHSLAGASSTLAGKATPPSSQTPHTTCQNRARAFEGRERRGFQPYSAQNTWKGQELTLVGFKTEFVQTKEQPVGL